MASGATKEKKEERVLEEFSFFEVLKLKLRKFLGLLKSSFLNIRNRFGVEQRRVLWRILVILYKAFLIWDAVKPGGGRANPRSKYNAPSTVSDRYRRGNRRWSSFTGSSKRKPRDREQDDFWTIIATATVGCSGGPSVITYSCNCPDFSRKIAASPSPTGENKPATGRQFTPRTFDAASLRNYRSQWMRFTKAWKEFQRADYIGIRNSNEFIYRVWTNVSESSGRDWTLSNAGSGTNAQGGRLPCKHIWMVIIRRGDPYNLPSDIPEDMGF